VATREVGAKNENDLFAAWRGVVGMEFSGGHEEIFRKKWFGESRAEGRAPKR
jgi:hypothetical protein